MEYQRLIFFLKHTSLQNDEIIFSAYIKIRNPQFAQISFLKFLPDCGLIKECDPFAAQYQMLNNIDAGIFGNIRKIR